MRTTYHQLPYKRIPKVLIRKLVMRATKMLNLLPAKGGISSYLSPYTIVTRHVVDYEKEFSTSFGAYTISNLAEMKLAGTTRWMPVYAYVGSYVNLEL